MHLPQSQSPGNDDYLVTPRQAWFAFALTFGLMLFDYIDRQVIVSLFPHMKSEWGLSDKQLGGLVSVISVVVAVAGLPVALLADRFSRVRSVVVMALIWSVSTVSCMFAGNYSQLFAARALVGAGEAGYGSVGAALIASLFPRRLRGALLGAFFAAASLGSVLGVLLGGVVAAKWGWRAAFGVVGVPGIALALLYMLVKDYKTVELQPANADTQQPLSAGALVQRTASSLAGTPTLVWACLGAAMQLVVVSAIWSWLPSFLNRYHGMSTSQAAKQGALVVLAGAIGSFIWGTLVDRFTRRSHHRLQMVAGLCVITTAIFLLAFAGPFTGSAQFGVIAVGGFVMACTVGPISAVVFDVVHPAARSTGAAVLSLTQNLLGLAVGPFLAGWLSDHWGLQTALSVLPLFGLVAAACFIKATATYEADMQTVDQLRMQPQPEPLSALSLTSQQRASS